MRLKYTRWLRGSLLLAAMSTLTALLAAKASSAQEIEHLIGNLRCDATKQSCALAQDNGMKLKKLVPLYREVDTKPYFDPAFADSRVEVDVAGRWDNGRFFVLAVHFATLEHKIMTRGTGK